MTAPFTVTVGSYVFVRAAGDTFVVYGPDIELACDPTIAPAVHRLLTVLLDEIDRARNTRRLSIDQLK